MIESNLVMKLDEDYRRNSKDEMRRDVMESFAISDCEDNCARCYHDISTLNAEADYITRCERCDQGYLLNNATNPVTCDRKLAYQV